MWILEALEINRCIILCFYVVDISHYEGLFTKILVYSTLTDHIIKCHWRWRKKCEYWQIHWEVFRGFHLRNFTVNWFDWFDVLCYGFTLCVTNDRVSVAFGVCKIGHSSHIYKLRCQRKINHISFLFSNDRLSTTTFLFYSGALGKVGEPLKLLDIIERSFPILSLPQRPVHHYCCYLSSHNWITTHTHSSWMARFNAFLHRPFLFLLFSMNNVEQLSRNSDLLKENQRRWGVKQHININTLFIYGRLIVDWFGMQLWSAPIPKHTHLFAMNNLI